MIALAVGVAGVGTYYAASWPGFEAKQVRVSGNAAVPAQAIVAKAALDRRQNIWLQNTGTACGRVRTLPYIDTCTIRRIPPAGVTVQVTERKPFLNVRAAGKTLLVDAALRVLDAGGNGVGETATFPTVVDPHGEASAPGAFLHDATALALRSDYVMLLQEHVIVRELRLDTYDQLVATLPDGVIVYFGDTLDLRKKASLVTPILAQLARGGRPIRALDLRSPSTPVVIYRQ